MSSSLTAVTAQAAVFGPGRAHSSVSMRTASAALSASSSAGTGPWGPSASSQISLSGASLGALNGTGIATASAVKAGGGALTSGMTLRVQQSLLLLESFRMSAQVKADDRFSIRMSEAISGMEEIRKLLIHTGEGDDVVNVDLKSRPSFGRDLRSEVAISTGAGNDIVNVRQNIEEIAKGYVDQHWVNVNIDTGSGNDIISLDYGRARAGINTGSGNDIVDITSGAAILRAGSGDDVVRIGERGLGLVFAGSGNDIVSVANNPSAYVRGGAGDDLIDVRGTSVNIVAGTGDDRVRVGGSADHEVFRFERTATGLGPRRSTKEEGVSWFSYGIGRGDGNDVVTFAGDETFEGTIHVYDGLTQAGTTIEEQGDSLIVRFDSGDSITFENVDGHRLMLKFSNGVTIDAEPGATEAVATVTDDPAVDISA